MTTTVGGGLLDRLASGQATQHALLSPSFLPRCPSAGRGWGQACPVTSLWRVHTQGSPPPVPCLQAGGFPAQPQKWDFYEGGLTENDLGGLF